MADPLMVLFAESLRTSMGGKTVVSDGESYGHYAATCWDPKPEDAKLAGELIARAMKRLEVHRFAHAPQAVGAANDTFTDEAVSVRHVWQSPVIPSPLGDVCHRFEVFI